MGNRRPLGLEFGLAWNEAAGAGHERHKRSDRISSGKLKSLPDKKYDSVTTATRVAGSDCSSVSVHERESKRNFKRQVKVR